MEPQHGSFYPYFLVLAGLSNGRDHTIFYQILSSLLLVLSKCHIVLQSHRRFSRLLDVRLRGCCCCGGSSVLQYIGHTMCSIAHAIPDILVRYYLISPLISNISLTVNQSLYSPKSQKQQQINFLHCVLQSASPGSAVFTS